MRYRTIYIILLGAVLLAFASCKRRPSYVLSENKMMDVLYDIRLTEAIYNSQASYRPDSMKDALVEGVLRKHNITQAELDSSLYWYSENINQYVSINDTVTSRLRANGEKMRALVEKRNNLRRNQSEYIIPPYFNLTEMTPTMSFNLDSSQVSGLNLPAFIFKFDVQGLNELHSLDAGIFFKYRDTTLYEVRRITRDSINYAFAKPYLPDSLLKGISGYVHLRNLYGGNSLSSNALVYNIIYSDSVMAPELTKQDSISRINNKKVSSVQKKDYEPSNPAISDMPVISQDNPQVRLNERKN